MNKKKKFGYASETKSNRESGRKERKMESIKLSKKELKNYAELEEGYYFTGNVYSYENIINCLGQLAWRTEAGTKTKNKKRITEIKKELLKNINSNYFNSLKDIVKNIDSIKHDSYSINQLYYSAGIYGNNGQLHQLKLYKNDAVVASYVLYY